LKNLKNLAKALNNVIREGGKEERGKKLGFSDKDDFGFSIKEINLPLSTSPCRDLNNKAKLQCKTGFS